MNSKWISVEKVDSPIGDENESLVAAELTFSDGRESRFPDRGRKCPPDVVTKVMFS